jgi:branched-chain amino acid transport system substrate-binding protein
MRLPVRPVAPFVATVCAGLIAASLIAACGGSSHHRTHSRHKVRARAQTVEVYSSLPLVGPSGAAGRAVQRGIRLAWIQANRRAGDFLVRYTSLNDARVGHGSWAAALTAANAREAAVDPAATVYIGDFDSSATRVSLPILNQAGIPQISPWSPYVGLTRAVGDNVTSPGDPGRYYSSTSMRTFLRLAPDDAVQAAALLQAAHDVGCTRMAVLRSAGTQDYSSELSGLLALEHVRFDVRIVSPAAIQGSAASVLAVSPAPALRRYVDSLRHLLTGCVAYVGAPSAAAVSAIAAIHAALPRAALFGSDRVCQAAFGGGPLRPELVAASGGLLECTYPALPSGGAASARFQALWQSQYADRPPAGPWAAYGYEAMRLTLQAIARLGSRGDQRGQLLHALFGETPRGTLLGSYGFRSDGDSTLRAYGLWQVRATGPPRLERVMEPSAS